MQPASHQVNVCHRHAKIPLKHFPLTTDTWDNARPAQESNASGETGALPGIVAHWLVSAHARSHPTTAASPLALAHQINRPHTQGDSGLDPGTGRSSSRASRITNKVHRCSRKPAVGSM